MEAGWEVEREEYVQTGEGLLDGRWEVAAVLDGGFEEEVRRVVRDERERAVVLAARDACEVSVGGVERVRSMDVWVASFV